jgi:predicted nuclease with TOPRIM domain
MPTPRTDADQLTAEMDALSLEQALKDFDVANARVLDLSKRLTGMTAEHLELRDETERLRNENARLRAELDELKANRAYKMAQQVWTVRRIAGR